MKRRGGEEEVSGRLTHTAPYIRRTITTEIEAYFMYHTYLCNQVTAESI